MRWLAAAVVILAATEASAQHYLGRTVTDVRVEIAGVAAADAMVLELVETRVGEPLAMRNVRATVDHMVGLGRFEDVRVFAAPTDQGVALRWQLMPVKRISKISIDGHTVLPAASLRAEITDRFGAAPSVSRIDEMVTRLRAFYAARGFLRATIRPRVEDQGPAPERAQLVLTIDAGDRVSIGSTTVAGRPLEPEAEVLRKLDLATGRPFDQIAIDARLAAYEESLRERGYYEARVRESHVALGDQQTVALSLTIDPGPHVSLVFAGDPLPDGNRSGLVPIREERSVDQDLLEDASRAIEDALREQGYRDARAPYAREEKGGELVVTFTIARGPLHRIESVEATGHARVTAVELAPLLQVKAGDPFVEARIGIVAAAITELYRVRGFAQATVQPGVQVLPPATTAGVSFRPVSVRFQIDEGPQTIVSNVAFEGAAAVSAGALAAQMALQGGKPFYRPQLAVDRDSLERIYRNQGFHNVSVISQLAFARDRQLVAVTWTIREGDQITIDRVLINGNARVSAELIRRELTIQSGGPISDDAMIESQRRLAALGLFRRVRITELPRTGSLTRDILVDLEETETTTVDYGGGVEVGRIGGASAEGAIDELDIGPRGFLGISRRNLWGKNRSVTVFGRVTLRRDRDAATGATEGRGYGFHDYRGLFTFREPRALGTSGDAQLTAFVEQARRTSFSFNRRGVTADYARRFAAFTVTGRYTFDHTRLFDEQILENDLLLIDRLFPQVKLSKFFGSVLRDSRDDVLDPQRGAVIGVDGSVAAKVYGSEIGFVKSFMQGFVYRRLPWHGVVLAAGARLGVAIGFPQAVPPPLEIAHLRQGDGGQAPVRQGEVTHGDMTRSVDRAEAFPTVIKELPASERFFAGGDTTVRGFALDRLGTADTLDPQGFPQGGNGLAIFNFETRAPYWKDVQVVWFVDAGNVFKRASNIRLDELRLSSGIGLRYRSPIGPLRVDWGWKLSTRLLLTGGRDRSNVLHISLGQAF